MATITGSGKYVSIMTGRLRLGVVSNGSLTPYCNTGASTLTSDGYTYKGIADTSLNFLYLSGVNEFSIGDAKGYTGTIKMYTYFYDPYNAVMWDPDWSTSAVQRKVRVLRFIHGFMVGDAF